MSKKFATHLVPYLPLPTDLFARETVNEFVDVRAENQKDAKQPAQNSNK